MRRLLAASAALLAACQPGTGGNAELNGSGISSNRESDSTALANDGQPADPDAPVSSDDPPRPQQPEPELPRPDCPIIGSSDWQARVDAKPGPDNPRLIVSGRVTVPTGGYKVSLRMGQVAESYPVQITMYLDAIPPAGPATQALETREVRGSWRSEQRVGAVTIRCGSRSLARIANIGTAH